MLVLPGALDSAAGQRSVEISDPVVLRAAAVGQTADGRFVGSTAEITVSVAHGGDGHIFLDTFPLTEIDMQGSARLASRVAAQVTGQNLDANDFFFVIRTPSQQIGGPSAGATMTLGAIAALMGWQVRDDVLMTGTISPDGAVGPVGGVAEKAQAAAGARQALFLYPAGIDVVPYGDGTVDLRTWCPSQLGIECRGVADIYEAVTAMTDHEIVRPPVGATVRGEAFVQRLGDLSTILLSRADALDEEAARAIIDMPSGTARNTLEQRLVAAEEILRQAHAAADAGSHYTGASQSFQASIDFHYVRDFSNVLTSSDANATLRALRTRAQGDVASARGAVEAVDSLTTTNLEAVGAAQTRVLEAETRLVAAAEALAAGRTSDAVYEFAYASERAATATWWLSLGDGFAAGQAITADGLDGAARDAITTSREQIAYVAAVLREVDTTFALQLARDTLASAETALERDYVAAALLDALEAGVRASVTLEAFTYNGAVPEARFESARIEAARAIQGARDRGVESLLAQSAYEFGLSLQDPVEELVFLGTARVVGNLAGLTGLFGSVSPVETRFQAIPNVIGVPANLVAAGFAAGIALGVAMGLLALARDDELEDA